MSTVLGPFDYPKFGAQMEANAQKTAMPGWPSGPTSTPVARKPPPLPAVAVNPPREQIGLRLP